MTTSSNAERLRQVNRWKFAGLLFIFLSALTILLTVDNLFVSFVLAFVISYTVGPLVNRLERKGLPRVWATTGVFLSLGLLIALSGVFLFPKMSGTLTALQDESPRYIESLSRFINELESRVRNISGPFSNFNLTEKASSHLTFWTQNFFAHLPTFLKQLVTVMLLAPFLAFFMVKDGRVVFRRTLNMAPNHLFETVLSLQHQINTQVGQFVRARIMEAIIVGVVTTAGLLILKFPYAILLGIFAGVTNLIPYLGPIIGLLPALFFAVVTGLSSLEIFLVILVYLIAQLIDAALLIPLVVAKLVDLHPVTVIVVIIAGAQLMGVLGMIISIPVASTLKVTIGTIYRHLTDTRT